MRESISGIWTTALIATFTLLFISFLCVMISFNKVARIKNDVINIIEKYNGYYDDNDATNNTSGEYINQYLIQKNYKNHRNECTNPNAQLIEVGNGGNYCIAIQRTNDTYLVNFEVELFYTIDLPIVRTIATFSITGTTTNINPSSEVKNFW